MMTEESAPQQDMGQAPETAGGQSQGHRRRRRRRKNKSQQGAAPAGAQQQPQAQAPPPPPPPPPSPKPQKQQQQGQGQGQGRKKKKFFEKRSQPQASPGNSTAPQKQRRTSRQKGPREFVGPMDHSYRVVNGNVADGPPSTIQMHSNYGRQENPGNYYSDAGQQASAAARADAPARIFCFIEDLFFLAKIQDTAKKLGVKVEFVKGGDKEAVTRVLESPEGERPALVVFDLNNANAKPMTLIPKFKTKFKRSVSIIGFLSHIQGDLKIKATEVGCDTVMPRSAFSQSLPNLLRRYGLDDEDDSMPQPV